MALPRLSAMRRMKLDKPLPFVKLLPNLVTLVGLAIGMSSIRFALDGRWEAAVTCILVATFMDALDGKIARMLNATSIFGAELDSLCDFANFGIAPAFMIYLWSFQKVEYKLFAWAAVLLFIICMSIRLARFNTTTPDDDPRVKNFFIGVPAPVGAILMLMPIMIDFDLSTTFGFNIRSHTLMITFYQIIIALLLPSRLPTFSLKNLEVKPEYVWVSLLFSGMCIVSLMVYTWYVLPFLGILYLCIVPVSVKLAKKVN